MTERTTRDQQVGQQIEAALTARRPYVPPRLQEFGRLVDLTGTQQPAGVFDAAGGSFQA